MSLKILLCSRFKCLSFSLLEDLLQGITSGAERGSGGEKAGQGSEPSGHRHHEFPCKWARRLSADSATELHVLSSSVAEENTF